MNAAHLRFRFCLLLDFERVFQAVDFAESTAYFIEFCSKYEIENRFQ
jgi:hypothetical protein